MVEAGRLCHVFSYNKIGSTFVFNSLAARGSTLVAHCLWGL